MENELLQAVHEVVRDVICTLIVCALPLQDIHEGVVQRARLHPFHEQKKLKEIITQFTPVKTHV
jgi:hypothetical protein